MGKGLTGGKKEIVSAAVVRVTRYAVEINVSGELRWTPWWQLRQAASAENVAELRAIYQPILAAARTMADLAGLRCEQYQGSLWATDRQGRPTECLDGWTGLDRPRRVYVGRSDRTPGGTALVRIESQRTLDPDEVQS